MDKTTSGEQPPWPPPPPAGTPAPPPGPRRERSKKSSGRSIPGWMWAIVAVLGLGVAFLLLVCMVLLMSLAGTLSGSGEVVLVLP